MDIIGGTKDLVGRMAAAVLPQPQRFLVLSRGRTGSNLLLSLLDDHPQLRMRGEVIGESVLRRPQQHARIEQRGAVAQVQRALQRSWTEKAVGIKVLYYQLEEAYAREWGVPDLGDVLPTLVQDSSIKVLHLKRRDRLRTLLSLKTAALTKEFLATGRTREQEPPTLTLDPEECIAEFERIGQWEAAYGGHFQEHPVLDIHYEDLVADRAGQCQRITEFLEVSPRRLRARTLQQAQRPPEQVIENYAEVQAALRGTAWVRYFPPITAPGRSPR